MNGLSRLSLVLFLISTFFLNSCKDKSAEVPSYLYIDNFELTSNYSTHGFPSHKITDVWVYVNGRFYGIYELPVRIPVIEKGKSTISLLPGIKENGSYQSRFVYRMLTGYEIERELTPNEMDTIRPKTTYRDNAKFVWIEDYESGVISTVPSSRQTSNDSIVFIDSFHPNAFRPAGINSKRTGYIRVNASATDVIFEHLTIEKFILPRLGADVYLELDYKCNVPLQIGLYAEKQFQIEQIPFILLNPTEEWNKIYINLKPETSEFPPSTPVQIFFGFLKSGTEPDKTVEVFLDNIKLGYLD